MVEPIRFIDVRGSATGRGKSRQQKHNGIVTWYFDHVVESLLLMFQATLLLLGCISNNTCGRSTPPSRRPLMGATSFRIYIFIIAVEAAFTSCLDQTPGSQILHSAASTIASLASAISSAFGHASGRSETVGMFRLDVDQLW